MAITKSKGKAGQKPPKEALRRIKEAAKYPINLEAAPELSPEALKEFAHMAAERDQKKKRQVVTLRLAPDDVAKYKSLGKGYTSIMADVLNYAANNPEILSKVR
ncbi:BrnA antitoxin family protein [Leadbettera azotonutricia]|uniref:Uncharacterized protein n=1 Tax=Leadbettera azotonutricia (strain ATCC BAA-888 / DSM 13862 / ZAS-9) TaxID=545695 RepID=F5Y8U0_LEAAZ|nr:BrnA antitoxin family protein [Leadbettera azotonutricia]AEF82407.1 conserved hypothetical protein [Leadbettera azotonutricia ZAS-9]